MVKEDYSNFKVLTYDGGKAASQPSNEPYVDDEVLAERKRREESVRRQEIIAKKKREAAAKGKPVLKSKDV